MNYSYSVKNEISQEGLNLFGSNFKLDESNPDALLVRSAKLHELVFNTNLKAIGRAGVGVNNIPIDRCSEAGIVVFNTPGANANAVKELTIAALILSSRDVLSAHTWISQLDCEKDAIEAMVEANKAQFSGQEIAGKTLGVIGLGAIGVLIANAAHALGMDVLGYDPFISIHSAWGLSRSVRRAKSYDEVFSQADYLTLHVPFNPDTKHLINKDTLKKMKSGVRVLNFARAELVDDQALSNALEAAKVAKYVTDFPNAFTKSMKNCIQIPHLGASTPESEVNCAKMAVTQVKDYLEQGIIKNSVNFPECDLGPCVDAVRLSVLHRNIPNMVGQITSLLGQEQVNIAALQNASKKEWAYTVLDLEKRDLKGLENKLMNIDGIVSVRLIQPN